MKTQLILLTLLLILFSTRGNDGPALPEGSKQETVVLLHGLVRSDQAMKKMARRLKANGYTVINHDYPSTTDTIENLTIPIFTALKPQIKEADTVHFVTHSLGGNILRQHLQNHELPNLGRVVMLAPPSRGSEVTDKLGGIFLYQWINGPAGNQLGTGTNSHSLRLKDPDFELGIIAGDRSINPILSMLIPGSDDDKVAISRVKPATYTDYLQLHTTHATIMWNKKVISQTQYFLEHGCFKVDAVSCRVAAERERQPSFIGKEVAHD